MSVKSVEDLNHNISTLQVRRWDSKRISLPKVSESESKYQGAAASSQPVTTVAGAELHYICIKKTCYEYEGNGGPQS